MAASIAGPADRPLEPAITKTTLGLDAVTAHHDEGFDFVELGQALGGDRP
jgi:hypothetical protein